jgi:uncharacterized protein (DUF2141 family)
MMPNGHRARWLCTSVLCELVFASTPAAIASDPFSVSGVLLNDTSSEPVNGAFVVVEQGPGIDSVGMRTGADGKFSFANLSSDQYTVLADKRGFIRASRTFQRTQPGSPSGSISIAGDQIELRLVPQAAVAGRVTDSTHEPLVGATVELSRMYLQGTRTVLKPVSRANTNDLGEYRMFGLAPGRYYLSAFYQDVGSGLGLRKQAAGHRDGPDPGTEEYAVTYYPTSTEPEGATPVRLRPGQAVGGIDIQMAMSASFRVSGSIVGVPAGGPMPQVLLEPFEPGGLGASRMYIPSPNAPGFHFNSVAPGTYIVKAQANESGRHLSAQEVVMVGSASVENLSLELVPDFTIRGKVVSEQGDAIPGSVQFRLNGLEHRLVGPIKLLSDYTFENWVPGPDIYAVDVSDPKGTAYVKSVTLDQQPVGPNGAVIRSANHALQVIVSNRAGRVAGQVVDSDGHPVGKGIALLVASDTPNGARRYAASVGHDGSFSFGSLPPGKYRVACFLDLATPGDATWDIQQRANGTGMLLTVNEGDDLQITIQGELADPY